MTDSQGLTTEETIDVHPEKAVIHLKTQPSGIAVQINGNTAVAYPQELDTLINLDYTISVPAAVRIDDVAYAFDHLHFDKASLAQDEILYRCLISDEGGTATSEPARLGVVAPPALEGERQSEFVLRLTCTGDSTLDTFIIQRSADLENSENVSEEIDFNERSEPFTLDVPLESGDYLFFRVIPYSEE